MKTLWQTEHKDTGSIFIFHAIFVEYGPNGTLFIHIFYVTIIVI